MVASRKKCELAVIAIFAVLTALALATYITFSFPNLNDGFVARRVTILQWSRHGPAEEKKTVVTVPLHDGTNTSEIPDISDVGPVVKTKTDSDDNLVFEKRKSSHAKSVTAIEKVFAVRDLIWFVVTVVLVSLTLWSYVAVATTDPGTVPEEFKVTSPNSAELALAHGNMDVCVVCDVYKPPRAHHCSRCGRCVLKYDHHCPWIAQCVGFFNYKLYLVFIFYAFLLSLLVTFSLSHAVYIFLLDAINSVSSEGSTLSDWSNQTADLVRSTPGLPIGSNAAATNSVTWPVVATWLYALLLQSLLWYLVTKHRRLSRHSATTLDEVMHGTCTDYDNEWDISEEANLAEIYGDEVANRRDDDGQCEGDNTFVCRRTGASELTRGQKIRRFVRRMLPIPAYSKTRADPPVVVDPEGGAQQLRAEDSELLVMSPRYAKVYGTLTASSAAVRDTTLNALSDGRHSNRSGGPGDAGDRDSHRHHHRHGEDSREHQNEHQHRHRHRAEPHPAMAAMRRGTLFRRNSTAAGTAAGGTKL